MKNDDAGKSPLKRNPTTTTNTAAASKRPRTDDLSSISDEIKDTASSNQQQQQQEDEEEVEIDDIDLYHELEDYETEKGVNPVEDPDHMKRFYLPYILLGIGNEGGWETKIRHLKLKFKNDQSGDQLHVSDEQMEEYLLWKKMFARLRPPDSGSKTN